MHKKSRWLKTAGLKSETEGFIIAALDQTIKTNCYRLKIRKDGTDNVPDYYVFNSRKPLTISWQGVLSWPKLNTYTDTKRPSHTYT